MSREYTHIRGLESEIYRLREEGKTRREIAEHVGLEKRQIKSLISRHNQAETKKEAGILPRPKGRPRKDCQSPKQNEQDEVKRLHMENELLRDFLRAAGRK